MDTIIADVSCQSGFAKKMRWGAVIAGLVVAIVTGMLLNLLGIGLGLITLPLSINAPSVIGVMALLWSILTAAIAMFIGGWITGFFSHTFKSTESRLYGIVIWALATLIGFLLSVYGAGSVIGGLGSMTANSLGFMGNQSLPLLKKPFEQLVDSNGEVFESIRTQVEELFKQGESQVQDQNVPLTAKEKSEQMLKKFASKYKGIQLVEITRAWLIADKGATAQQATDKMTKFLTDNTELTAEDARKLIDEWQHYYNDMKRISHEKVDRLKHEAEKSLSDISRKVGTTALGLVLVLLVSGAAASYGSVCGARVQSRDVDVNNPIKTGEEIVTI